MMIKQYSQLLMILFLLMPFLASASESQIAYLAHTGGFWQVWTMTTNGEDQKLITTSQYDKTHLSGYPDGQHILVNGSQGQLRKVNIFSRSDVPIKVPLDGILDAVISPSGKRIAFSLSVADSVDNNHIWVSDIKSRKLIKMTNMAGLQHEPAWSIDGKWIYFLSSNGRQSHDIWRVSIATKSTEQLTINQLYHFDLAFSSNNSMAFSSNRTGNYDIWLRDSNHKEHAITHNKSIDSRPSFSEDGKEIVFESSRDGVMNIYRKAINGKAVQLTHEKIGARYPVWLNEVEGNI